MAMTTEDAYKLIVREVPPGERLRLAERILHDLSIEDHGVESEERYDWRDAAGIAPNLLDGEDAQEWVSRSRRESDEQREKQWKDRQ